MSVKRFRLSLVLLAFAGLCLFGASMLPALLSDPDGWEGFSPIVIDAEPLIAQPSDVLTSRHRETIRRIVAVENQDTGGFSRRYGIPWSVAVVRDSQIDPDVSPDEYAATLLNELEIESEPDADDGLLMMAVIPEGDHTATTVHFATGHAFYPRGGITPEHLEWIAEVQMAPYIADNTIGDAIIEGAYWVEWMQFFEPPPNPAPTILQTGLGDLLDPLGSVTLAGLAMLIAGGATAVAIMTRQGVTAPADQLDLGVTGATALAIGRFNEQAVAGVVLDASNRSVLIETPDGLALNSNVTSHRYSAYDAQLMRAVTALKEEGVVVTHARLVRYLGKSELSTGIEDDLARSGFMHPRSPLFQAALSVAAVTGSLLGIAGLVLAVLGQVESALFAALALTAVAIPVLIWNESRSWTTQAGREQLARWLNQHPDDPDRRLFETVLRHNDLDTRMKPAINVQPNA
jgi:hypothetical protein